MTTAETTRIAEMGDREDYPGMPRVLVNRQEATASLPGGGTYYTAITFTIEVAGTCPVCDGPICEAADKPVYKTAASVTIEPAPPVGEEHPWRVRVSQKDQWLTDPEVIRAFSRCLEHAAQEVEEWSQDEVRNG